MVSVIVPCRNEIRYIDFFLQSLLRQDLANDWEIIIADGCSNDGTREALDSCAKLASRVRVINNPRRHTAAGLNLAIRQARGEIVLRMDVHTEYALDYVRRSVECLQRTGADNVGGPARTRSSSAMQRTVAAAFHSCFSTGGAAFHDVNREGLVDTVPYGCWWRSRLLEIGLFDEDLIRNEDDELNLRIHAAGGRVYQSPDIRSWYYPRSSLASLARQYFQYAFWKVWVIRKHRRVPSWRHIIPAAFLVGNALLLLALAARYLGAPVPDTSRLLLALNGAYLLCSLVASVGVAKQAGWQSFWYAPVVFATFHLSYGLGFLVGWAYLIWRPAQATRNEAFTGLTR